MNTIFASGFFSTLLTTFAYGLGGLILGAVTLVCVALLARKIGLWGMPLIIYLVELTLATVYIPELLPLYALVGGVICGAAYVGLFLWTLHSQTRSG